MSFIVSKRGTFGTIHRRYTTEEGVPMVIIRWGALGWLTPVRADETKVLETPWQEEALKQAKAWVEYMEAMEHYEGDKDTCSGCGGQIQFVASCSECAAPDGDCFDFHTFGSCAKCLGCDDGE